MKIKSSVVSACSAVAQNTTDIRPPAAEILTATENPGRRCRIPRAEW